MSKTQQDPSSVLRELPRVALPSLRGQGPLATTPLRNRCRGDLSNVVEGLYFTSVFGDSKKSTAATSRARRQFKADVTASLRELKDTAACMIKEFHAQANRVSQ